MTDRAGIEWNQTGEASLSGRSDSGLNEVQKEYMNELAFQARAASGAQSQAPEKMEDSGSGPRYSPDLRQSGDANQSEREVPVPGSRTFPWARPEYHHKDGSLIESDKALDAYAQTIVDTLTNEKNLDPLRSLMTNSHSFSEESLRKLVDQVNRGMECAGSARRLDLTQTVLTSQPFMGGPSVAIFSNSLVLRDGSRTIAQIESMPGFQSLKNR